jgi:hypothetical protein
MDVIGRRAARTVLAISLTTVSIGCGAPQSATRDSFIGDWKLSPSRSRYTDVMKVQRANTFVFERMRR